MGNLSVNLHGAYMYVEILSRTVDLKRKSKIDIRFKATFLIFGANPNT